MFSTSLTNVISNVIYICTYINKQLLSFQIASSWHLGFAWKRVKRRFVISNVSAVSMLPASHRLNEPTSNRPVKELLFVKLAGPQLVRKLPEFYETRSFLTAQAPTACSYPEPDQSKQFISLPKVTISRFVVGGLAGMFVSLGKRGTGGR